MCAERALGLFISVMFTSLQYALHIATSGMTMLLLASVSAVLISITVLKQFISMQLSSLLLGLFRVEMQSTVLCIVAWRWVCECEKHRGDCFVHHQPLSNRSGKVSAQGCAFIIALQVDLWPRWATWCNRAESVPVQLATGGTGNNSLLLKNVVFLDTHSYVNGDILPVKRAMAETVTSPETKLRPP